MPKGLKKQGLVPAPDSFLRACKPTEGQGWAHVLCSVFISELNFTDSSRLRSVEGISTIPHHRWSTVSCSSAFVNVSLTSDLWPRHVFCARRKEAPSSAVMVALKNITRRAHGSTVTSLGLRCNLSVSDYDRVRTSIDQCIVRLRAPDETPLLSRLSREKRVP